MRTIVRYIVLLLFVGVSLMSYAQQGPPKALKVRFHNLTCHYNVWWNGNESLKAGLRELELKAEDDYTQILPVYQLGTKEQALMVKSQMDKAIEKGIKGLKKHSVYYKGREYVSYVKNCYLLTAYGTFYEQDYAATDNTCRLIISQFAGSKEADEAKILMARSLTCQKQYIEAESALDQLVNDQSAGDLHKSLSDKLFLAMVECTLPQEKYKKAVQYIRLALDETNDHQTKARLYYIMAQVYQKLDKRPTASKYFAKVLKYKPNYVMEFNARINVASCADVTHTNVQEVERDLDRMLRDKKNEEFKDQIYYAKGDMYLGVKDAQKACDNYKLSVGASAAGSPQKAKSALRLAEVLYDVYENYDEAQSYYDTAIHIINMEYPHYDEIKDRYTMLTSLVEYTRLVYLNDSLFAWADMDPTDRSKLIQLKIEKLRKQEEEERERALLAEMAAEAKATLNTLEGDWYFYNSNSVNKGKEAFRQKWGTRLLEDYWFLSQKGLLAMGSSLVGMGFSDTEDESDSTMVDSTASAESVAKAKVDDPTDPHCEAYYLKDLPTRVSQRDSMHADIARCLLNAGYIYYDGIKNTELALECYLRMAKDYPDDPSIVQAFYQLYRIYTKQGNTPSANYYRDMVLMGFPDSDFANLIRDDEYYLEIVRRSERAHDEYTEVYRAYSRHKYADVITKADKALQLYDEEPLMGKFRYWKGMAYIQQGDRSMADSTFKSIVRDYADTSRIVELAREQLGYLDRLARGEQVQEEITAADEARAKGGSFGDSGKSHKPAKLDGSTTEPVEDELPPESQVFRYRESMQHYVVVLLNDKKIVATQMQYKIADFNAANYANSGYRSSPMLFNDTTQMITIHRYQSAKEAMDYYTHILLPGGPLEQYDPKDFSVFVISTQNYSTFYNKKDVVAYRRFFEKYYLNNK